ncbi:MAG: large conductance mechanosensitive channel protein MscL [Candidatus Peribacteraceae bacterium]|nr:large conductance mechanosensitive channel protein MscL [Candidatus Peribacteraceae bacterium]MDD5074427.1 large conductance mechanosensitive channel protein MscL [Candidatus Peribacteraceae bacterium]
MSILQDFKQFASRGNVVDLAVGVIIGAAFGKIISSLVNDMLMPLIGILLRGVDFSTLVLSVGGAQVKYGMFIQSVVDFLIVAFSVFLLVKYLNKLQNFGKKPSVPVEPTTKECPHCCSVIPLRATRCSGCTAQL